MIELRRSEDRGHLTHGWLDTYHTFSFGDYRDPAHTRFRLLRVINEDRVDPGQGFAPHSHQDMEIFTYILEGALEHKDSMGTHSVIKPGEVQRMSAGTGVTHSEHNASDKELVHLLQIWIFPEKNGLPPSYEQKFYPEAEKRGRWRLVASRDGKEGSVTIHQDVRLFAGLIDGAEKLRYDNPKDRYAWVQVARGTVQMNGEKLKAGDGICVSGAENLSFTNGEKAELLLFDLA